MSASSATTLISPSGPAGEAPPASLHLEPTSSNDPKSPDAAVTVTSPHLDSDTGSASASGSAALAHSHTQSQAPRRRGSVHSTHGGHGHGVQRRTSTHAHVAHRSGGPPGSRRGSEGDSGRRALAAGLTMHTMDQVPKQQQPSRRKSTTERPLAKSSRSDTHLPRLSRTASHTSNTSHVSSSSQRPRKDGRTESVEVIETDGTRRVLSPDEAEEGWESGEDDGKQKHAVADDDQIQMAPKQSGMPPPRRAASDTVAATAAAERARTLNVNGRGEGSAIVDGGPSPILPPVDTHNIVTQKMTGFSGATQEPEADFSEAAHQAAMEGHVAPPFQLKHRSTASLSNAAEERSLVGSMGSGKKESERTTSDSSVPAAPAVEVQYVESPEVDTSVPGESTPRPPTVAPLQHAQLNKVTGEMGPTRMQSTEGSGIPGQDKLQGKTFPFPRMASHDTSTPTQPEQLDQHPRHTHHHRAVADPREEYRPVRAPASNLAQHSVVATDFEPHAQPPPPPSQPQVVQPPAHTLRHRPSHSSIRSVQSLRAPPHPLNSPTGARSLAFGDSPGYGDSRRRVTSLHYPPAAPAVVYRETVNGQGWEEDEDPSALPATPSRRSGVPSTIATGTMSRDNRSTSFSSTRGLKDILGATASSTSGRANGHGGHGNGNGTSNSPARSHHSVQTMPGAGGRRLTALEATSAAARLNTTKDPVAYHHSLGFSATVAETAHLLSRFLPARKVRRPGWVTSNQDAQSQALAAASGGGGAGDELQHPHTAITDGPYRDAHESLIRTMRDLGRGPSGAVLGIGNRRGHGHTNSYSHGHGPHGHHGMPRSTSFMGIGMTGGFGDAAAGAGTATGGGSGVSAGAGGSGFGLSSSYASSSSAFTLPSPVVGAGGHGPANGVGKGSTSAPGPAVNLGATTAVKRGDWAGKTPLELSIERCIAQRPRVL